MTLQELTAGLMVTYQQPNAWRYQVPGMANEILRRCTGLTEAIRKNHQPAIHNCTADIMAWIITMSGGLGIVLDQILSSRFPGCCPYCRGKPCQCQPENKPSLVTGTLPQLEQKQTLRDWQKEMREIYGAANQKREPPFLTDKLVEEAGEVVTATYLHQNKPDDFTTELADLVSRLFAIANYLGFDLEKAILDAYPNLHCGHCGKRPCTCTSTEIARNYRPQ